MSRTPWSDIVSRRWDWAERATQDFRSELDPWIRSRFDTRPRDFSAVLIGPTQVGKTTVLLELLDVDASFRDHLAQVLRAGRGIGMSSTAAPMRYRWSTDELWRLHYGSLHLELEDDDSFRTALEELRSDDGSPVSIDGVCEVSIPARYRGPRSASMAVLDLPGTHASDSAERALADDLIGRYVLAAHIVILVLPVHQLSKLDDDAPDLLPTRELRHWYLSPARFRVVLTYTFSTESMQQELASSNWDVSFARAVLIRELKNQYGPISTALNDDPGLEARLSQSLFPLEFGDSWEQLQQAKPTIHEQALPVRTAILDQFITSLADLDLQDSRYTSLAHAVVVVERQAAWDLARLQEERDQLARSIERSQVRLHRLSAALERAQGANDRVRAVASAADHMRQRTVRLETRGLLSGVKTENEFDSGQSARLQLAERSKRFDTAWARAWSTWSEDCSDESLRAFLLSSQPPSPARRTFLEATNCCGDCTNSWWPLFAPSPARCAERQRAGALAAISHLEESLQTSASAALLAYQELPDYVRVLRTARGLRRLSVLTDRTRRRIRHEEHQLQLVEARLRAAGQQAETDVRRARGLQDRMRAELASDLVKIGNRVKQADENEALGLTIGGIVALRGWYHVLEEARLQ